MQRYGWVAVAILALMSGHMDQAGAGSKWWKRGCSGCSAPVMVGCHAPLSSCAGPYNFGCSGCYAPTCGSPYGYQPAYMMPSCYAPSCSHPAFYAPNCSGCSAPVYGCAASCGRPEYAPYYYQPNPMIGPYGYSTGGSCAGGYAHPEYAPYVYQPSPYVNRYGVGAPQPAGTPQFIEIALGHAMMPASDAYPQFSSYSAPVAQSIPSIPPLPPAEDIAW